jgi:PAS domain S-box-containing protein
MRKNGSRFWASVVITALRDRKGTLHGFGKVTRDLTERQAGEKFRGFVESAPDAVVIVSRDGEIVLINSQTEKLFGYSREELLGQPVEKLVPQSVHADHPGFRTKYFTEPRARPMGAGLSLFGLHKDGHEFPVEISLSPVETKEGTLVTSSIRDITQRKRNEEKIKQQAKEIMEMATVPIVQVWEGVVLAPLIGTLDQHRTQKLMERLLHRITETGSSVALLDITGVPTLDTETAQHLIETISAVKLLGAEVILTGVRPIIAQTLVHLGIDLSNVITRASLSAGLRMALNTLNLTVAARSAAA